MELEKITDITSSDIDIHADDSTIYLFGSELYCGHCLEAFTCPVRLKIHCHIEHLARCTCGGEFNDKQSLCQHVANFRCSLPPPFEWFHFVNLPNKNPNAIGATKAPEGAKWNAVVDENSTAHEKSPVKSVTHLDESVQKTTLSVNQRTLPKKSEQKKELQQSSERKYCCGFCSYQSVYRQHCRRHIQSKHVGKPLTSFHISDKHEDCITVGKGTMVGSVSKDSATLEGTTENELNGKPDSMNPDTPEACCDKHTSSDIQFVVSCFSSAAGGESLHCDLCSGRFNEWEKAAMHVFDSHFPALQQWRDTHENLTRLQISSENTQNNSDQLSNDIAFDGQVCKNLPAAAEYGVPEGGDDLSSENVRPNVSETISLERNFAANSLDQSNSLHLENQTKHKYTAEECKELASSLCRLLNCVSRTFAMEIPDVKTCHNSEDGDAATESAATPAVTRLCPTKLASRDSITSEQQIARKCKFCHRMCSNSFNRQKHEMVCRRTLPPSKLHGKPKARFIGDSGRYYCTVCGFSDSDQHTVNAHLKKPHLYRKPCVESGHGYDYIGSMRVASGGFRCSLCSVLFQFKSQLLKHLASHSSSAVPCETPQNPSTESLSESKVDKCIAEKKSGFVPVSRVHSCPKCSQSFFSISGYLQHCAVCQAVPRQQTTSSNIHYLLNLCEVISNGRWKCKLCMQTSAHRCDMFKHIRAKHEKVQKAEMEACVECSKTTPEGLWQCKLCKRLPFEHRDTLYRHIRIVHSAKVSEKLQASKLSGLASFGFRTSTGKFQCTSCKKLFSYRSGLYRHVRSVHGIMLSAKAHESNAVASSPTSIVSSPRMARHSVKNTDALHVQLKSQAKHSLRACLSCHRLFANSTGYNNHRRMCEKLGLDCYVQQLSSSRFKCSICGVTYSWRYDCRHHIRQKHLFELKSKTKQFVKRCLKCGREFTNVMTYRLHMRSCEKSGLDCYVEDLSSGRFKCRICSMTFKWRYSCSKHIRQHHPHILKPKAEHSAKRCPKCSREFKDNSGYQIHRKTCEKLGIDCYVEVTSDSRLKCRLCGSIYNDRYPCRRHIRDKHLVSGELANMQCDQREMNANSEEDLDAADDSVPTSEPYKNDSTVHKVLCEMEGTADDLMSDTDIQPDTDGNTLVEVPTDYALAASEPNKGVSYDGAVHEEHSANQCPRCSRKFKQKKSYKKHRTSCEKSGVDCYVEVTSHSRLKCRLCGSAYSDRKNCRKHIRHKHLASGKLANMQRDHPEVNANSEEDPGAAGDSVPASEPVKDDSIVYEVISDDDSMPDTDIQPSTDGNNLVELLADNAVPKSERNKDVSYDGTVHENVCEVEEPTDDAMPSSQPNECSSYDGTIDEGTSKLEI